VSSGVKLDLILGMIILFPFLFFQKY
jgi:hypothetical protein